jgi:hypothetical protein
VRIELQCEQFTDDVILHLDSRFVMVQVIAVIAKRKLQHATLEDKLSNRTEHLGSGALNDSTQTIIFNSSNQLNAGHVYYLTIWFSSSYSNDFAGLTRIRHPVRADASLPDFGF